MNKAAALDGSVIVSGSPRTPPATLTLLREQIEAATNAKLAPSVVGGLGELFDGADEIVVTGDSMAMLAEAILTKKPVGILPLELSNFGWRKLGVAPARTEMELSRRDLRRYWQDLWDRGLAGTIDEPRKADVEDPSLSAARVATSYFRLDNCLPPPSGLVSGVSNPGERFETQPFTRNARGSGWTPYGPNGTLTGLAIRTKALAYRTGRDAGALALAARDPRVPWYVKLIAWIASLTAISPIDLTPDFIPFVGYLDDLVLMAIGTAVAVRLIPPPLWAELRSRAVAGGQWTIAGTAAVLMVWLSAGTAVAARLL